MPYEEKEPSYFLLIWVESPEGGGCCISEPGVMLLNPSRRKGGWTCGGFRRKVSFAGYGRLGRDWAGTGNALDVVEGGRVGGGLDALKVK